MTINFDANEFIWAEKYRPKKLDDVILPERIKEKFAEYIATKQIPHMLFSGSAGIGKTTVAKAICNEIDADMLYINASKENGIDTIRVKVTQFASTVSLEGNLKVILLDEADKLSFDAQSALRATMEEFSKTTRFILTCNFKYKMIEPMLSRCTQIEFRANDDEKMQMQGFAFKRCLNILRNENIEFDKEVIAKIVARKYPDMRSVLNALQDASIGGKITSSSLSAALPMDKLYEAMKDKKFTDVQKWVAQNAENHEALFRDIYDNLMSLFEGPSIPQVVLTIDQYQDRITRVADPEITIMACMVELMGGVTWK